MGESAFKRVVRKFKEGLSIKAKALVFVITLAFVVVSGFIGARNLKAPRSQLFNLVRALLTFYELVMIPVGEADNEVMLVMDARRTTSILKLTLTSAPLQLTRLSGMSRDRTPRAAISP